MEEEWVERLLDQVQLTSLANALERTGGDAKLLSDVAGGQRTLGTGPRGTRETAGGRSKSAAFAGTESDRECFSGRTKRPTASCDRPNLSVNLFCSPRRPPSDGSNRDSIA
jgi:hypothetical protein